MPAPGATLRSKAYLVLLVVAAAVGLVVSFASWGFLELVHQIQTGVFTDLPRTFGYDDGAPIWWSLPFVTAGGLIVAFAIERLPGRGGASPADGLHAGVTEPIDLPGVLLAAFGGLGLGLVLGPEAPLIALGAGLGLLMVRLARRDAPDQALLVISAAGSFAAMSLIFDSPLIAAVLMIEAAGLGGDKLPVVLLPGLLAGAIGSLVATGMGSWTGLSTSDFALGPLALPAFARPEFGDFAWTVPLAAAVAVGAFAIVQLGRATRHVVTARPFVLLPLAGLAVGGAAIAFAEATGKGVDQVLFSGEAALPGLVSDAGSWSLGALALLIAFKGLAWGISLGSFRGGPTFPAILLGAAAGVMASHLPGLELTPAVAVGMGAAVAAVLRLPLSAVVLSVLLTARSGSGSTALVVVGVVVAYVTTVALDARRDDRAAAGSAPRDATPVG